MSRIFSGVQPSGALHIGNWLGAIRNWVDIQHQHESIFCVVDLHSITLPQDPKQLRQNTRDLAAWYIACGIDPAVSTIMVQSAVPQHAELCWILNTITPLGWLYRMTQFKVKSENKDSVGTGILDYPVLMAADILLYNADVVPVGADQAQHVELCRDIAERFNHLFGQTFTMPKTSMGTAGSRIMGLDNPEAKMSKSDAGANPGHAVFLSDAPDVIRKKLKRAVTDSGSEVRFDEAKPGVNNLLTIYQCLSGQTKEAIEGHFAGKLYGHLKGEVGELLVEKLAPIQAEHKRLMDDRAHLEKLLADGAERVLPLAKRTIDTVKERVGLG